MEPNPPGGRRDYARRSQADRLHDADTALKSLVDNPEIRDAMTPAGYGPPGVTAGRALYTAVVQARSQQGTTKRQRLAQTAAQTAAVDAAEALYRPLAETARTLFRRSPADLTALGLTGEHGDSLPERIDRLRSFADAAREPARLPRFEAVGIQARQFDALTTALGDAGQQASTQDDHAAQAQDSSVTKADRFAALDEWMLTLHGHARVRLKDRPQLLEALGLRPR